MTTITQVDTTDGIRTSDLVVDHTTDRGSVRALECSAIAVDAGTSLAVMGPSGCGKSTLLGLLAGLAVPTQGTVAVDGETISVLSERDRVRFRRRRLGMVYQADNLLPHLTVEENVGLQLAICRADLSVSTRPDVGALLGRLDLTGLAKRLPDELSGGQRQRAAVARALIHRPGVILADEPTGALDDESAGNVIELLTDLQQEIGATMVVVTHDPDVASHMDRVIRLSSHQPSSVLEHHHAC